MIQEILLLIFGLVLLVKGANYFVEASARLAKKLGVSEFIIGLTLTAIGTSVPELASSISAAVQGAPGLIIGNVVGSNIANIGLVIGIAACIGSFKTNKKMYNRDAYFLMLSVIALIFFALDGSINGIEAIGLLILYFSYVMFLIATKDARNKSHHFSNFLDYFFKFKYIISIKTKIVQQALKKNSHEKTTKQRQVKRLFKESILADFCIMSLALVAIVIGAKYLVLEAVWLAELLSIPKNLIGLSLIAIGTSLPELMVSITAARKGFGGILLGNILGSNIANTFLILGVSSSIIPISISELSITYTIPIMAFFSLFLVYIVQLKKITRKHGIIALTSYIIFMICAFLLGWS